MQNFIFKKAAENSAAFFDILNFLRDLKPQNIIIFFRKPYF